ncbi:hypothetical protein J6590_103936 [Homalodisca vitripennis]|nr:hypothetical protein J6590_103936 [Homalodisca vitripennis]
MQQPRRELNRILNKVVVVGREEFHDHLLRDKDTFSTEGVSLKAIGRITFLSSSEYSSAVLYTSTNIEFHDMCALLGSYVTGNSEIGDGALNVSDIFLSEVFEESKRLLFSGQYQFNRTRKRARRFANPEKAAMCKTECNSIKN